MLYEKIYSYIHIIPLYSFSQDKIISQIYLTFYIKSSNIYYMIKEGYFKIKVYLIDIYFKIGAIILLIG